MVSWIRKEGCSRGRVSNRARRVRANKIGQRVEAQTDYIPIQPVISQRRQIPQSESSLDSAWPCCIGAPYIAAPYPCCGMGGIA